MKKSTELRNENARNATAFMCRDIANSDPMLTGMSASYQSFQRPQATRKVTDVF